MAERKRVPGFGFGFGLGLGLVFRFSVEGLRFDADEAHEREGEARERVHGALERRLCPPFGGAALDLYRGVWL